MILVHHKKHIQRAREYHNWTMEQWKKVTWTDESRFLLHHANGRARVLLLPGEVMLQDHCGATTSRWRECDALSILLETLDPVIRVDVNLTCGT